MYSFGARTISHYTRISKTIADRGTQTLAIANDTRHADGRGNSTEGAKKDGLDTLVVPRARRPRRRQMPPAYVVPQSVRAREMRIAGKLWRHCTPLSACLSRLLISISATISGCSIIHKIRMHRIRNNIRNSGDRRRSFLSDHRATTGCPSESNEFTSVRSAYR